VLSDPKGDASGPGTYYWPLVPGFRGGTFDLREVTIREEAGGLAIRATFDASPEEVLLTTRQDSPGRKVFMPAVDLYAVSPGGGIHKELLPGRRVLPGDPGWDRAIVLTAVPDLFEAHYRQVASVLAGDVCFARAPVLSGKTISAFVPRSCLPKDLASAGYLVVAYGTGFGSGLQDIVKKSLGRPPADAADPFVREVTEKAGTCSVWEDGNGTSPCTFGGCEPCGFHPYVIDAIVPADADQGDLLKSYSAASRRLAALPFVRVDGGAFLPGAVVAAPNGLRLPVAGVRGNELTIRPDGPQDTVVSRYPQGTLGAIICPGERPGGTVVVRGTAAGFLSVEKVDDGIPVCEGAVVEF